MIDSIYTSPYNIDMSNKTTTEWHCLNCNKLDYKPAWLAKERKYCSRSCAIQHKVKLDPLYFSKIKRPDPLKISATLKAKGIVPPSQKGVKQSEATKLKRGLSLKNAWASGKMTGNRGKKCNISPEGLQRKIKATQAMRRRIAHNGKLTDIEQIIDNYLHNNKVEHEHEYPVGTKCEDFYLPIQQIFIEADSDYWHKDKEKDLKKDLYVSKIMPDVDIVRCNEASIKNGSWVNLIQWGAKRGV